MGVGRRAVFRDMKAMRSSAVVPWITVKPLDFEGVTYPVGTDVSPLIPRGLNLHNLIRLKTVTSDMALADRINARPVVVPFDAPRDMDAPVREKAQVLPRITLPVSLVLEGAAPAEVVTFATEIREEAAPSDVPPAPAAGTAAHHHHAPLPPRTSHKKKG